MKKTIIKYYDYFVIAVVYGVLHIFMHTDYWDDLTVSGYLPGFHFNFFAFIEHYYRTWTSRIFIFAGQAIMGYLPNSVWKLFDILLIFLLYHCLKKLAAFMTGIPADGDTKRWEMLLFMTFPFSLMGTTGWITSTMMYTWAFALAMYGISLMLDEAGGKKTGWGGRIAYGLALLYASSHEVAAIVLMLVYIFLFIAFLKGREGGFLFWEGITVIVFNLILFALCPGNRVRMIADASYHNSAELLELSLAGKIRMGINSAFYHFVSVPNALLFIFCLLLLTLVFLKGGRKIEKIAAAVPLGIDLFWTGYMFLFYTLKNRALTYVYPDAGFLTCPKMEQYIAVVSALLMIAAMLYSLAVITDFSRLSVGIVFVILVFGLLPEVILGFTTTVSASIIRVSSYFYFAVMLCAFVIGRYSGVMKKGKLLKTLFLLLGVVGMALNILQVTRHIMVYG